MTKKKTLLLALLIAALLVLLWFLRPLGHGRPQSVRMPAANPPVMSAAAREEWEKFEGTWEFVSMEVEGVAKPDADFKKYTAVLKGGQWTVYEGTNIAAQTTVGLDPATTPKSIDLIPAPDKGQIIHGIYLLEGDKLTVCDRDEDHGERPTEFATEPDSGLVLLVLKRVQR